MGRGGFNYLPRDDLLSYFTLPGMSGCDFNEFHVV